MRGRAPFYLGVSMAALMVGGAALIGAEALFPVAGEDGIAILFADADPDLAINWASTPASEYNGSPFVKNGHAAEAGKLSITRASLGMRYDSAGVLRFAPHNQILRSQEFDNASWTKVEGTVSANATTAPDGTSTADTFIESTTVSANHSLQQGVSKASASLIYTASVYVKAASGSRRLTVLGTRSSPNAGAQTTFDIAGGQIGIAQGTYGAGFTGLGATITNVGNGWYRVTNSFSTDNAFADVYMHLYLDNGTGTGAIGTTYTGDGTSGLHLWGAQLERNLTVSEYVATTTAAVHNSPRYDHNPLTPFAPRGLLVEEQRTNLALRSQELDNGLWTKSATTVSADAAVAPDGTTTADSLVGDGTAATHSINQTVTFAATTAYATSFYAKKGTLDFIQMVLPSSAFGADAYANFDLNTGVLGTVSAGLTSASIQDVGNGWYRCTVIDTSDSDGGVGTPTIVLIDSATSARVQSWTTSGTVHIWGLQCEAGAFATSYIPTTTASVTRSADDPISAAVTLFPFSATVGTLILAWEVLPGSTGSIKSPGGFDNNTTNEVINFRGTAGASFLVVDGGVAQANINLGNVAATGTNKVALAWAANDFAGSLNGAAVGTDVSGTLPTPTLLKLGNSIEGSNVNGWMKSAVYLPRRMTNGDLVTQAAA